MITDVLFVCVKNGGSLHLSFFNEYKQSITFCLEKFNLMYTIQLITFFVSSIRREYIAAAF
jgi:hypothetical protein